MARLLLLFPELRGSERMVQQGGFVQPRDLTERMDRAV
jgi:hypothetical protein